MFKKSKKKLSVLLVLAMVMTMLTGLAAPAGATTVHVNVRGVSVNVAPTTVTVPARALGLVELTNAAERVVAGGNNLAVEVRLPAGFTFPVPPTSSVMLNGVATPQTLELFSVDDAAGRGVRFTVAPSATGDINSLRFLLGSIVIPTGHRGAINAEVRLRSFVPGTVGVQEITMWEQTATVQVGNVLTAGTTSAAVTKPTIQRGVAGQTAGNITITEDVVGSIGVVSGVLNEITLTAPAGVLFTEAPSVVGTGGMTFASIAGVFPTRTVVIDVATASTTARSVITVSGIRFNVEPQVADGDVGVTIVGSAGSRVTPATVSNAAVGVVAVGQVTVDADPATPAADRVVTAGRLDAAIADIRLRETTAGAIQPGRVVSLTLPVGFTWHTRPITFGSNPEFVAPAATSDAGRTISFWTSGVSTEVQTRIFSGLKINASAAAPAGDIVVTVGGTAGVSGTVVVGRARTPYTVTAVAAPNLRADQRGQLLGNLVVTENFAGAIRATDPVSTLTVTLPAGVTVSAGVTPTVVVTGGPGTMAAGTVNVADDRRSFNVAAATTASTAVSTWTISNIRVDLDRVPTGNISVTAGGAALISPIANDASAPFTLGLAGEGVTTVAAARALVGTTVASVNLGNVVSATATSSVFTIGALSFTRDGVTIPIDAAPAIVEGRTLLPLRFAAMAVGVSADNILWDPVRRTVTLIGDRVVQLQIGSRSMLINGVAVPLEVAPTISGGRTMLPIRAVATALRADVVWDATARTVTVTTR